MKRLVVVVNDLERSGKTSISRAIHHFLAKNCELKSLFVTSDDSNLSEDFDGEFWDIDEAMPVGPVMDAIESHDAVVFDVHSAGARNWNEFFENTDFDNILADLGAEMTLVIPNTGGERCNEEIVDLVEIFSDMTDYLIVHTETDKRDRLKWKGSEAEEALRYLNSQQIKMPKISEDLVTALESAGQDLCEALSMAEELPRFAEVQITQWLEEVSNRLEKAGDYLLADSSDLALEY